MSNKKKPSNTSEVNATVNAATKAGVNALIDSLRGSGYDPVKLQACLVDTDATKVFNALSEDMARAMHKHFGLMN